VAKQIIIDHVFKVFGDDPKTALDLVQQGLSKQEILERTGQSIGVFDAHFTIEAGEIFVVMGLSGSGKSTLVRMLNRLIEPTAGRIVVDGKDINALNERDLRALRRKDISMVFQSFALMPQSRTATVGITVSCTGASVARSCRGGIVLRRCMAHATGDQLSDQSCKTPQHRHRNP
jgi:ABC-type proline/glycine betaine transport system ATPase subunit